MKTADRLCPSTVMRMQHQWRTSATACMHLLPTARKHISLLTNPLTPTVLLPYGYSYKVSCARPG